MRFNREIFFREFKNNVLNGKTLRQPIVDALNDILDQVEKDTYLKSPYHLAYMLGTAWHETAFKLRPIKEYGGKAYFIKNYWNKVRVRNQLGNKSEYDAWARSGRGYVQLTGLGNDIKMTAELKRNYKWMVEEFEQRTGQTFDLVARPEQALDPKLAYAIMVIGMSKGIFTGKKVSDYISNTKHGFDNYRLARYTVNGQDKASAIANYAMEFEKVIRLSLISDEVVVGNKVKPTVDSKPVTQPEQPVEEPAIEPIDEYPENPKPGEAVPDAPAESGEPITGGRPADEAIPVEVPEADKPTGVNAWIMTVRTWWLSLGVGTASLGSIFSGLITSPLLIKVLIGIVAAVIIVAFFAWIIQMIIRAVHVRAREKEAFELAKLEMAIKADPTKYNVTAIVPTKNNDAPSPKGVKAFTSWFGFGGRD